ncbi:MAG: hypothetical protein ABIR19_11480 [Ginsengibacter sp.]
MEEIYDEFAPKIYGFLLLQVLTKAIAERLLILVFEEAWKEVGQMHNHAEKRLLKIVLCIVRQYKSSHQANQ